VDVEGALRAPSTFTELETVLVGVIVLRKTGSPLGPTLYRP
jgi:hypothetical protein